MATPCGARAARVTSCDAPAACGSSASGWTKARGAPMTPVRALDSVTPPLPPRRHRTAHRLDEHLGHLRPAELRRRRLARSEQLPHPRAGERDALVLAVGAGLAARHRLAGAAGEGVLEEERRGAPLPGRGL